MQYNFFFLGLPCIYISISISYNWRRELHVIYNIKKTSKRIANSSLEGAVIQFTEIIIQKKRKRNAFEIYELYQNFCISGLKIINWKQTWIKISNYCGTTLTIIILICSSFKICNLNMIKLKTFQTFFLLKMNQNFHNR